MSLEERVVKLGLHGVLENWDKYKKQSWLEPLVKCEEKARQQRGLERRLKNAKLGAFKTVVDFDWKWPKKIDRAHIEEVFSLDFIGDNSNVVLIGPNGVGKTLFAKNLVYKAVLAGYSGRFTTASEMLNDLAGKDSSAARTRCARKYIRPQILAIDEIGYLSYDNRHADLLFEIVSQRYEQKPTVITTNKAFGEWNEVFPNATCVVTLVDRLVHRSEIINIDAESYRLKESKEAAAKKKKSRRRRKK